LILSATNFMFVTISLPLRQRFGQQNKRNERIVEWNERNAKVNLDCYRGENLPHKSETALRKFIAKCCIKYFEHEQPTTSFGQALMMVQVHAKLP